MNGNCLFCKIVNRDIKADVVYEDNDILAFKDINPQAPVHLLIVPKKHIPKLNDLSPDETGLMGKLILKAKELAGDNGIAEDGYRTVINCNRAAGQEVFHLHIHLLGGRPFAWPPG